MCLLSLAADMSPLKFDKVDCSVSRSYTLLIQLFGKTVADFSVLLCLTNFTYFAFALLLLYDVIEIPHFQLPDMSVCYNRVKIRQFPYTHAYSQAFRAAPAGHSSEITGQWCNLISDSMLGNVRCLLKVDWMAVWGFWQLHGQTVVCMIACCSGALTSLDSCGQWSTKVIFTHKSLRA